ncbi:unnamed protein product [Cylicocyclus nassatus]|uniref:Uncharacterized protein n=1 Tax=Cylicocyclus nassatus TaxID=53992 RepID=A0AA36H7K7_CYLNA|nr:unnamed protein product [Cylicocyclus nassatus]
MNETANSATFYDSKHHSKRYALKRRRTMTLAHISEQEESSPDSSELRCRKIAFNFVRPSYGLMRMDLTPKCIRKRRAQGPLT